MNSEINKQVGITVVLQNRSTVIIQKQDTGIPDYLLYSTQMSLPFKYYGPAFALLCIFSPVLGQSSENQTTEFGYSNTIFKWYSNGIQMVFKCDNFVQYSDPI